MKDLGEEFDAFIGVLIAVGADRSNRENFENLWKPDALPI